MCCECFGTKYCCCCCFFAGVLWLWLIFWLCYYVRIIAGRRRFMYMNIYIYCLCIVSSLMFVCACVCVLSLVVVVVSHYEHAYAYTHVRSVYVCSHLSLFITEKFWWESCFVYYFLRSYVWWMIVYYVNGMFVLVVRVYIM